MINTLAVLNARAQLFREVIITLDIYQRVKLNRSTSPHTTHINYIYMLQITCINRHNAHQKMFFESIGVKK